MVGRPVLWGLAVEGAAGAASVLGILLGELDAALALAGSSQAGELGPGLLSRAAWAEARR